MESLLSLSMIIVTVAIFGISSYDKGPLPDIPVTQNVTFEKHIKPITSTVCVGCHYVGSNDYSRYYNAVSARYSIHRHTVVDKTMPMGKHLSDEQRALFRDWFNQGVNR